MFSFQQKNRSHTKKQEGMAHRYNGKKNQSIEMVSEAGQMLGLTTMTLKLAILNMVKEWSPNRVWR